MNEWWWFILGAALAGPVCAGLTFWACRRMWLSVRRLTARAKGQNHLLELGQLAGGLAHEIKNPLSTINVNLKLLAEDIDRYDDETHRRWLRRLRSVQGESDRLRAILDDFLRYAGKYELSLSVQDLRVLVGELTDFFAPQAQAARVLMRTSLSDQSVLANVDANLIKQALLNLMINAVQAMPQGGELLIRVQASRGLATIEVIDTGGGIPADQLARVFDVYYSTKKGGTGLGLPTSRRIIREHDGTIQAESEIGRGTRFLMTLPLASPARAKPNTQAAANEPDDS